MLGKLYHTLAIISIAILLAGSALVGLLYGTGKLTPERVETIAQVLRGELDETAETEGGESVTEGPGAEQTATADSTEDAGQQQRDEQLRRALGERAYRDLVAQRNLLDQALQHLITEEERFEENKAAWTAEQERRRGRAGDEGFEKECRIVSKLPAKLAKEHVLLKWKKSPADVVRLFNALPESTGKRILEQMKTPAEIQVMHELLELLSKEELDS